MFRILLLFIMVSVFWQIALQAEESKELDFQSKVVVPYEPHVYFRAEVTDSNREKPFIRSNNTGYSPDSNELAAIVSEDYFGAITNSSPLNASLESIYLFHGSSRYRWFGDDQKYKRRDDWIRYTKFAGVVVAGVFYSAAVQRNRDLSRSLILFNDEPTRAKFVNARNNFYYSAGALLIFTLWAAIDSYMNFDTNEKGEKLDLVNRKKVDLEWYLDHRRTQNPVETGQLQGEVISWTFAY